MKTPIWFIVIVLFLNLSMQAQEINKKIVDENLDEEILIGYCDRQGLQSCEFGSSYVHEYEEYIPQKKIIKKIKRTNSDYNIVMILATWCHDSQEQVPRFFRILDEAKIDESILEVICVDGEKTVGDLSIEEYNIERVPTFIFYRNGAEIGRIIETPEVSLEEDMLDIIRNSEL